MTWAIYIIDHERVQNDSLIRRTHHEILLDHETIFTLVSILYTDLQLSFQVNLISILIAFNFTRILI